MSTYDAFVSALHDKGWFAAVVILLTALYHSVSLAHRLGRMEQRQLDQGAKLDYLVRRFDTHTDKGNAELTSRPSTED